MKELEYIYTVYKQRSFSAAAKKLFVSQPTLSVAVKKAEQELGIKIFDRSSFPMTLTAEGEVYIAALEQILSTERTMKEKLGDIATLKYGHITVSGENFVTSFILPEVLMRFSQIYEGIEVELVESNSPDLKNQLLSETIDLLVAHDFDSDLYEAVELFEENVILAVPENFTINKELSDYSMSAEDIKSGKYLEKKPVDLSKFKNEEFLTLKPGNDMNKRSSLLCGEVGFQPKIRISLDQLITSYNLTAAGMGIAFVTDVLVKKADVSGCLYYTLKSKYSHRTMSIGYKKSRYMTNASRAFIKTAREVFENQFN